MGTENDYKPHWFTTLRHRSNRHRWASKLARLVYYRLIVPIRRERRSPHVIAMGAVVGLIVGFTPTVGIQMPLVFVLWWLGRQIRFHFSLILAIAWSWLSNPATMVPLYYVYYKTGAFLLPDNGERFDFDSFAHLIESNIQATETLEGSFQFLTTLIEAIGFSLVVGCLPYAVILPALGYYFTRMLARKYQELREAKHGDVRS